MNQSLGDAARQGSIGTQRLGDAARQGSIGTQSLEDAAEQGSIDTLYSLIRSDAQVFKEVDDLPFADTPLHIAASSGQINFAVEIMRLRPSYARKLNKDGYTPLHLALKHMQTQPDPALKHKQTQLVLRLIDVDENLICVPGREGLTPLHYVTQTGDLALLTKFLKVCPRSIEDITTKKESVLHIALRWDQIEAFELLLGWLQRSWLKNAFFWEKRLLNWQDEDGNTLLHIAISKNQTKVVQLLLGCKSYVHYKIDLNAENSGGYTIFDIASKTDDNEIKSMLCRAKCLNKLLHPKKSTEKYFRPRVPIDEKLCIFILRQRMNISLESRNMLLVVAVLLITVTFQTTVSPPGGVWEDSSPAPSNDTAPSPATGTSTNSSSHTVGTSTMSNPTFVAVAALNLISYFTTVFAIFVLLPSDLDILVTLPLHLLSSYFVASILITAPRTFYIAEIIVGKEAYFFTFCVFTPLLILLFLQLLVYYKRRKLFNAFYPEVKELDPSLAL